MKKIVLVLLACAGAAFADDWPQWLGEHRDGIWREAGVRKDLPEQGAKIRWRAPLSWGYAGPAVAKGRVYVPDFVITNGLFDGESQGGQPREGLERLLCFDAESGEQLWKHEYAVTYTVAYPGGPRVTPTVAEGRLYFQGTMGHLWCLEARSGEVVWRRDICAEYQCQPPRWGYASHPLVHGDLVYAVAGGNDQVLLALDKKTGKERWKALSSEEAGYCPPSILKQAGVEQLLFWYPEAVVSLNPANGKTYWSVVLKPVYGISRMAPRRLDNQLFISGPGNNSAVLLEFDSHKPGVRELWRGAKDTAVYTLNAPPQIREGIIYGVDSETSALIGVSMKNGERLWSTTVPSVSPSDAKRNRHGTAFLVYHETNQQYWIFGEMGALILAELSAEGYKELGRQSILEPTNGAWGRKVVWSHPAFANRSVFARNDKELVRVDLAE